MQGLERSSNAVAHDLTLSIPAPAPDALAVVDMESIPGPTSALPLQSMLPGTCSSTPAVQGAVPGPGDACQPLLMWVRPLMQRNGDSMLFEMRPAQDLPAGCWAQSMRVNSWCATLASICFATGLAIALSAMKLQGVLQSCINAVSIQVSTDLLLAAPLYLIC